MTGLALSPRLAAAAEQVRTGVALYDVGTDHAYLPAFLILSGRVPSAVASDVAPGPLSNAEKTIREAGLCDKIQTVLADGLTGVALRPPCDVVVAGMGGELIIRILSGCPTVKEEGVSLILQPMTKSELLRDWLAENGFSITAERVVREKKLYEILVCRGGGTPYALSEEERYVGRRGARREDELFFALVRQRRDALSRAAAGLEKGGADPGRIRRAADELTALLDRKKHTETTL